MKQSKLINPLTAYFNGHYDKQPQPVPGIQAKMQPLPDCGEKSYQGHERLSGRKLLVTGGDSGIGRAAAIAYAREGADVAINYLPAEEEDAKEVANLIQQAGQKAVCIPGDVSDEAFCQHLVSEAHQKLGGLDGLTLVAGKQHYVENIEDVTTEQIRKTYEINVFSLFWIIKAALPHLPAGATIVTTTSIEGYHPDSALLDYAGTKAAIAAFTHGLAKQLAPKGIRVNSVAPGPIWTPLQISGGQPESAIPDFGQQAPLKRAGQPVELAGMYVYLTSAESSYVTAEVFGINGGLHL
ncbi:SDR family oxidoreductase [Neisseriaceae bacterium ESL0693]|nr:SDR family oxidoreductase [Neisseriaceae bacterium ESL0693]